MLRTYPVILLISLSLALPSQAGCVRDALVALTQKLSGVAGADEAFKKYYDEGDPEGWKKIIEETVFTTGGKVFLGGNSGNTHLVSLPNGSSWVTKEFPSASVTEHLKILQQMESWNSDGLGPSIVGVSLLPGRRSSEKILFVVMEDLLATKNNVGQKIEGGNGREVSLLKREPEAAKSWIVERMLSLLDRHPDPHPMNAVFRVTRREPSSAMPKEGTYYREGDRIYQVFLIDPSGAEGNAELPIFNSDTGKTPPALLQYNRAWKKDFFKKQIGLR